MGIGTFINATCTLLEDDDSLHVEGLEAHLLDQWKHGIDGLLVAGTMGMMPMLRNTTYRSLVEKSIQISAGRGEILVGAGDTSFGRTRDRIEFLNNCRIDGVVVMAPYLFRPSGADLISYFQALADVSRAPLYLYDLPSVTGVEIGLDAYSVLAEHPNIHGAKVSGRFVVARHLTETMGDRFRVIIAEPDMVDMVLRQGFSDHLDGIYAVAPHWLARLREAASAGNWPEAAAYTNRFLRLRLLLGQSSNPGGLVTAWLNARGIPGRVFFGPADPLLDLHQQSLVDDEVVRELCEKKL